MRKRVSGKRLSRSQSARRALFRGLTRALVLHGSIKTTKAKAKALQPIIDKLISSAKPADVNARRRVYARLGNDREVADKLFSEVLGAFEGVKSGFTKYTNLPRRRGDRAETVILEWSQKVVKPDTKAKKSKNETKKEVKTKSKK